MTAPVPPAPAPEAAPAPVPQAPPASGGMDDAAEYMAMMMDAKFSVIRRPEGASEAGASEAPPTQEPGTTPAATAPVQPTVPATG